MFIINTYKKYRIINMLSRNLKFFRLKSNKTKKELALECNLTPMAISNYESGKRKPSLEIALKLAKSLNTSIEELMEERNQNIKFQHLQFRKNSSLSLGQQEFVNECVEEYFSRFFNVVDILGKKCIPSPFKTSFLISQNDYEKDASQLRTNLSFSLTGPIDHLISHLESVGILVSLIDFKESGFFGINGKVNDYPYIAVNKNMTQERIRSTIAHELAHLTFDQKSIKDDEEEFATAVSGAFLFPQINVLQEIGQGRTRISSDMINTCKKYGISMFMLIKRSKLCGCISSSVEKAAYIKMSKLGWRKNEPSRITFKEDTNLLKQLVLRAYGEEEISEERALELLKVSDETLKKMMSLEVSDD